MVKWLSEAQLLEKLREIIAHGAYDLSAYEGTGGNGGVGALLEQLLGIKGNNAPVPDAVEFEIKSKTGNSLLTMLHREPKGQGRNALGSVIPVFGWPMSEKANQPGTLSFRQTINCNPSPRGFRVVLEDKAIKAIFNPENVTEEHQGWLADIRARENPPPDGDSVWLEWTRDEISRVITAKFKNLILVCATRRGANVTFTDFSVMKGFLQSEFYEEMRKGSVYVDIDAKKAPSAGVRNHGTKFRIRTDSLLAIYEDTYDVDGT